tara:strand:+ start:1897 stop:2403 length:507 start_codon:yes stop_codon:yes gene_type:complete
MGKTYKKRIFRKKKTANKRRKSTLKRKLRGGSNFVSPFQGTAYSQDNLPGMSLNPSGGSNSNYYPLNTYKETPFQYMKSENSLMSGGRKKRKTLQHKKSRKGRKSRKNNKNKKSKQKGGFIDQGINLLRYGKYEVGSAYNELNGYDKPVNPLPWEQFNSKTHSNFSSL